MQPVYVPKDPREKAMQRALMQYKDPKTTRSCMKRWSLRTEKT